MTKKELEILKAITKRYTDLAESGDAGYWNPYEEECVRNAMDLINKEEEKNRPLPQAVIDEYNRS